MVAATHIDPSSARLLTADEWSIIAAHRLRAVGVAPYVAALLLAMPVYAVDGITASVDRSGRLYVGMDFIRSITDAEAVGVLLHEVRHVLAAHGDRADARGVAADQRARWNRAADLTINDELIDGGYELPGDPVTCAGHGVERGLTAEAYFDLLADDERGAGEPEQAPSGGLTCGSGAGGPPADWELPDADDHRGEPPSRRDSAGPDSTESLHDEARDGSERADSPMAGTDDDFGRGLAALDLALARRQVAEDVTRHVARHGSSSVPAELRAWADEQMRPPTVSWREVLRTAIRRPLRRAAGVDDYTWTRPNRRRRSGDIILPATVGSVPSVAVVVDTSGSISSRATRLFVSELVGLVAQANVAAREIIVVPCDDQVHDAVTADEVIDGASLPGGRGTDMGVGLRAVAERRPAPDLVVVFTDGHTPWPSRPLPMPVVVVIGRGGNAASVPQWAAVVTIDE